MNREKKGGEQSEEKLPWSKFVFESNNEALELRGIFSRYKIYKDNKKLDNSTSSCENRKVNIM